MRHCGHGGKHLLPLLLLRASETILLTLGIQGCLPSQPPLKTLRDLYFVLLRSPSASSTSRPQLLREEPSIWFYSVIAPMFLLDFLPDLSFAPYDIKIIL